MLSPVPPSRRSLRGSSTSQPSITSKQTFQGRPSQRCHRYRPNLPASASTVLAFLPSTTRRQHPPTQQAHRRLDGRARPRQSPTMGSINNILPNLCNIAPIPLCGAIGPITNIANGVGIEPECYARNIELANTLIFQGATSAMHIVALCMTVVMVLHVRGKFTAVGTFGRPSETPGTDSRCWPCGVSRRISPVATLQPTLPDEKLMRAIRQAGKR